MYTIKKATVADILTIQHIAQQTWYPTFSAILNPQQIAYMLDMMYSATALEEQMQNKGHVFVLAQNDNKTLAYLSYELHYMGKTATKIHKLYALPNTQGKGVGKYLIAHVISEAQKAGDTALLLNVNRYNAAAGFYEKVGFRIIAQEDIAIGEGYLMEDFVMQKDIV